MPKQPNVADYMITSVRSVEPDMTVKEVADMICDSDFHGFPVTKKGYLVGFITAKELLRFGDRPDAKIREVMKMGTMCAVPEMSMDDAMRVLFRYGLRNLPVIDKQGKLIGIISNIDVVRSHIEKSRPSKVMSVKTFLEQQNGIHLKMVNMDIPLSDVLPTQKEVFMDELIGRSYEIKKGLNEPLIVVKRIGGYLIVDGHHRIMAAKQMGAKTFHAVVLEPDNYDVRLGLERTAEKWGLWSLDDVKIIEGSKHPFIEMTTRLMDSDEMAKLNERLNSSNQTAPQKKKK
ncbi:MAG: CBS domain-containing protein [Methanomassiliicoccaceae archaeon]|jgi:IMP dehydrogenase|nr:CBS domain-containing protein [Methanomassiliicoccaceae archaeon]